MAQLSLLLWAMPEQRAAQRPVLLVRGRGELGLKAGHFGPAVCASPAAKDANREQPGIAGAGDGHRGDGDVSRRGGCDVPTAVVPGDLLPT